MLHLFDNDTPTTGHYDLKLPYRCSLCTEDTKKPYFNHERSRGILCKDCAMDYKYRAAKVVLLGLGLGGVVVLGWMKWKGHI